MARIPAFIFCFLFTAAVVRAQTIGVAPYSHQFWGEIDSSTELFFEYGMVGLHYFHNWDPARYVHGASGEIVQKTSTPALSFVPLDLTYFRFGAVGFYHNFPVDNGSRLHFFVEAALPVRRFTISYRHISNGFGLLHPVNPGYDSFAIKFRFNSGEKNPE